MLPTQLLVLGPCLRLFQNPDDLFFGESFPLHAEFSLVFLPENSLSKWTVLWGERQTRCQALLAWDGPVDDPYASGVVIDSKA